MAPPESKIDGRTTATRERILEAAEQLIALHGVEGLQLKAVAARVGIRPPSIFAHFKGLEAIADAVAIRIVERLGAVLIAALDPEETDPMRAIRASVRAFVAHLVENPAHVRLLLRDFAQAGAGNGFDGVDQVTGEIDHRLQIILERGHATGVFRKVVAATMLVLIEGAILTNIARYGWDETGRPGTTGRLEQLQDEAEELAVAYVRAPTLPLRSPRSESHNRPPWDERTEPQRTQPASRLRSGNYWSHCLIYGGLFWAVPPEMDSGRWHQATPEPSP